MDKIKIWLSGGGIFLPVGITDNKHLLKKNGHQINKCDYQIIVNIQIYIHMLRLKNMHYFIYDPYLVRIYRYIFFLCSPFSASYHEILN